MREWLKWLVAGREMAELARWHVQWHEHRRWLAEFEEVGMALDGLILAATGKQVGRSYRSISELREEMRAKKEPSHDQH